MVVLVQISGFLGSGKTSAIIRMAMAAQRRGLNTAVIVNEIGDVDVDGEYIKSSGLKAKKILGGCICCSLGSDFVSTIKLVVSDFHPDVIFVEPTGVALPSQVKKFFLQASSEVPGLEISPTVVLVDGVRFRQLFAEFRDFLKRQIHDSEIIAITKIDKMDRKFELPLIISALSEMKPGAKVIGISSITGEGLNNLLEAILGEKVKVITIGEEENSVLASEVGHADFHGIFRFNDPVQPNDIKSLIAEILRRIGQKAVEETGTLIGHIKAYVESSKGGFKSSLVDLSTGVEFSGDIPSPDKEFRVSIFSAIRKCDSEKMKKEIRKTIEELSKKHIFDVIDLHTS